MKLGFVDAAAVLREGPVTAGQRAGSGDRLTDGKVSSSEYVVESQTRALAVCCWYFCRRAWWR